MGQRTDAQEENGAGTWWSPNAPNRILQKGRIRNAPLQNASDVLLKGIWALG